MAALAIGTTLGPYEILAHIGAGGMGSVYKARDTRLDRIVAIKISSERFSERFEREARAVATLNHPNVCQLYDTGPDYLVMEFVDGSPVSPPDTLRKLLDIAVQIADGMAAAHSAGIIHRDLKPDNILITHEGRVRILDFGLARTAPKETEPADSTRTIFTTQPGAVVGTIAYMSPEQARGSQNLTQQSDQFAFGLILYELASGKRAFQRSSAAELMTAIIREDVEPLPSGVPAPVRWVVERCLAKDPAERYDSTRDLYRELRQIREHLSEATTAAAALAPPVAPVPRKRGFGWAWALPMLAIGFAAAALWPLPPGEIPPLIPFATESEFQAMPRWSPKGDRIAYVAAVDGRLQILSKSPGPTLPTQITHEKQSCFNPIWSADATRIYFITGARPNVVLRSAAVAGGPSEKVLDGVFKADLSPDGKKMALLLYDPAGQYFHLAFSSPPGAPPVPYSEEPLSKLRITGVGTTLQFSPDGKYLGFLTNERTGSNEFWQIPVDGGAPQLREHAHANGRFTWSHDGKAIITDTNISTAGSLVMTDLSTGAKRNITSNGSRDATPALGGPDGSTLAFANGDMGLDIVEVPLDGSPLRDVVATLRNETAPAWAPDGVRFVYVTDRNGAPELWLRNRADRSERLIVGPKQIPGARSILDSVISPDGTRVAYRVESEGNYAAWISPLSGDPPVRLWDDPSRSPQRGSSWSPDGNWIAYYGVRDGRPALFKAQVGANKPPEFLTYMLRQSSVRWSPRGDWIAYQETDQLRIISPDGKEKRSVSGGTWLVYGWSNDGSAIYGVGLDENRHQIVGRIDIETGKKTSISDLGLVPAAYDFFGSVLNDFFYRGFSLHPDGRSFLVGMARVRSQIYLMSGFDRRPRLLDRFLNRH